MLVRDQIKRLTYLGLYAIVQRSRLFWLPFLITPLVIIGMSLSAPKQYVNHATILLEESSLLNPFLDDLKFSFELEERMSALNTLVLSRKVLNQVAKDAGLVSQNANATELSKMQQKLATSISLKLVGDELVKIHFKWTDKAQMKPVLESVVEHFIERLLAPTKASLDTSEKFFAEQLAVQRVELEYAEAKLSDYKKQHSDVLPELFSENRNTLQSIEKQKQIKGVELSGAKARLESLITKLGRANPIVGMLEEKIVRAESDLTLLKARYTNKHSKVQAKQRALQSLKIRQSELMQIEHKLDPDNLEQLWQMANTLPNKIGEDTGSNLLVSQIIALQDAKNNAEQIQQEFDMLVEQAKLLTEKMYQSSDIKTEIQKLERDYKVKSELYQDMLSRYEMAKVTGKLVRYEGPDKVKTIERAYSPTQPINMAIGVVVIMAIFLGIFAGFALIFIAELLDSKLKDSFRIRQFTGLEVISILPVMTTSASDRFNPKENRNSSEVRDKFGTELNKDDKVLKPQVN